MKKQNIIFLKNKSAITLISLIITIVIMLILAGVSVTTALNGGLFKVAEEAARGTDFQIIFKQILSSVVQTKSGEIDINATYLAAKDALGLQGNSVSELKDGVFTVKNKNETYTFTITKDEIIQGTAE